MKRKSFFDDDDSDLKILRNNLGRQRGFKKSSKSLKKLSMFIIYGNVILILIIIIFIIFRNHLFHNTTENNKSKSYTLINSTNSTNSANSINLTNNFFYREDFETYDELGKKIYSKTGTLSFNYLDKIFNRTTIDSSNSNFNHIHVAMSFNNDYHLLSSVTIASLLNNSAPTSFIHLHIIVVDGWVYPTMKKLNSLKYKINNNSEFIFHNGEQSLKDFGKDSKNETKGIGEYARLLAPYFANDTDRIIITDSADIFFENDLLELYNYPLDDKFLKGVEDPFTPCFPSYIFFNKEKYFNGGVLLVDAKKWRDLNLYHDLVTFYNAFKYKGKLPTPIQDILNNFFPSVSVGNLPFRYNFQGYLYKGGLFYYKYEHLHRCFKYLNKKEELIEEEKNIVIRHSNKFKTYNGDRFPNLVNEWTYYAKMTGFYNEICEKHPKACS